MCMGMIVVMMMVVMVPVAMIVMMVVVTVDMDRGVVVNFITVAVHQGEGHRVGRLGASTGTTHGLFDFMVRPFSGRFFYEKIK